MRLFHGSDVCVINPDVVHSANNLDFGKGFYLTSVQIQAERWAKRKARLNGGGNGVVSVFEFQHPADLRVKDFKDDLEAWIDFVCACRDGSQTFLEHDIIIGKVADDKVFRVVDMYKRGLWDKTRALQEIRVYPTYDQIAFISQQSIEKSLVFIESYEVSL